MDYENLPPFETPEGVPAPSAIDSPQTEPVVDDDVDDDELLDDDDSFDGDDEQDDDEDQDTEDAEAGNPAADKVAELQRQLNEAQQQLQEWNRFQQQQQEAQLAQQQAEAEKYWDDALAKANSYFAQKEAQIYREAEGIAQEYGSDRAEVYARTKGRELFAEYQGYLAKFHADREASIWQIVMKAALPGYAAEVAEYYGLAKDAITELLNYPPDLIPREAERMKRERDARAAERRKANQLAKRAKNLELGNKTTTPGQGRAVRPDIELGSDDHYNSIPWQRM